MGFLWCTINVKNMEESLKFYQEIVGLTLEKRYMASPDTEIAFLGDGETKIELIRDTKRVAAHNPDGISIGFEVPSVTKKIVFIIEKGLKVYSGPFQPNLNIKFFYVKDPNGVSVQFVRRR